MPAPKNLNIVIPVKQVPESSNVKMDEETGTMVREGAPGILNPLDLYAVETGIRLKECFGGHITVISMGPRSAETSLREALAMGCDKAVLITGREFAGSDTWVTSFVLSKAIEKIAPFDLILTGERATDGETGHVGPGIASFLDLPLASYTSSILEIDRDFVLVERLLEEGYETLKLTLPAVLTVVKEIGVPRLPTLRGKQRARKTHMPVWTRGILGIDESVIGLKGSPTRVVKLRTPQLTRRGTLLGAADDESTEQAVHRLILFLKERNIIQ